MSYLMLPTEALRDSDTAGAHTASVEPSGERVIALAALALVALAAGAAVLLG